MVGELGSILSDDAWVIRYTGREWPDVSSEKEFSSRIEGEPSDKVLTSTPSMHYFSLFFDSSYLDVNGITLCKSTLSQFERNVPVAVVDFEITDTFSSKERSGHRSMESIYNTVGPWRNMGTVHTHFHISPKNTIVKIIFLWEFKQNAPSELKTPSPKRESICEMNREPLLRSVSIFSRGNAICSKARGPTFGKGVKLRGKNSLRCSVSDPNEGT